MASPFDSTSGAPAPYRRVRHGSRRDRRFAELSDCGGKRGGLVYSPTTGRTPTNRIVIAAALAALLVASTEAVVLAAPDPVGCSRGTEYSGQRITLDFKDAEIVNVLRILSEIGGENVVITDDVKGRVTLRLVEVPWDQAFDVVLETNGLECVNVGGSPITVRRVSTISGLTEEREAKLAAEQAAEALDPPKTVALHVDTLPVDP